MISTIFQASGLFSNALKLDLASRCFIELYDGKYLVGSDGSLATVVRVEGMRDLSSYLDLGSFLERASRMLNSPFGQKGRAIQIWYERNPDLAKSVASELVRVPRSMSSRLGLDMEGFLDDKEWHLSSKIVPDVLYFILWTRRGVLTPYEIKATKAEKAPSWWPGAVLSQDIYNTVPAMKVKHHAWTNDITSSLRSLGLVVTALGGHGSIGAMRHNFKPNFDQRSFKPWLPGDPVSANSMTVRAPDGEAGVGGKDISHLLWPHIPPLVVDDTDAELISGRIIRLGENFYAPLEMKIGPTEQQPFDRLFSRLAVENIPFRMSVLLEGEGEKTFFLKGILSAMSGWSSPETQMIRESLKAAQELANNGITVLRTRISFATWGPTIKETETRLAKLQQGVETWGSCVTSSGGDPVPMAFSTMMALDPASAATPGLSNIRGALRFLPWLRSASPFTQGATTFVTDEHTPWLWTPGNPMQDSAVELVIGPPGKGKSVMMNTLAMSFILSPTSNPRGLARLPRYSLLDIGPSSYGLIQALRELLPPGRKDEAQYHRLTMDPQYSINPFDLQPGMRRPLGVERQFLVSLLCLMVTPIGESKVPAGLAELAGQVIDEAYRQFDDDPNIAATPKLWNEGEDPDVDRVLDEIGYTPTQGITTWYTLADMLHERGLTNEAILAQRNASPKLADLMSIVRSQAISDTWGEAKLASTGETITMVFWRAIANTLREYPIFQRSTQFRIGRGRVVALDLQQVTGGGSDAADRRTAIMYLLGRFALTRGYYSSKDSVAMAPPKWRDWHMVRAQEAQEAPARFAMDEFHRTSNAPGVRAQVETDMREGRKFNIQIILASQIENDFTPGMRELATCVFILGCNTAAGAKRIGDDYGLSDTAVAAIQHRLNGPTNRGAPFIAILNMKDGKHEHLLYNVLGPSEAWAYSTSPDDVTLRGMLNEQIPFHTVCRKLGRMFPGGSAKDMFKDLRDNDPTGNPFKTISSRVLLAA